MSAFGGSAYDDVDVVNMTSGSVSVGGDIGTGRGCGSDDVMIGHTCSSGLFSFVDALAPCGATSPTAISRATDRYAAIGGTNRISTNDIDVDLRGYGMASLHIGTFMYTALAGGLGPGNLATGAAAKD